MIVTMRLLTGPAGSGKTTRVLQELREALERQEGDVRLLVPTATLSEHLRNELARDGVVFRSRSVSTLAQFARDLSPTLTIVSDEHFHLMVEDAVLRLNRPEFEKVRELAGIPVRLAATIRNLDAAGATPEHLGRIRSDLAPFRDAIAAVSKDVARQMRHRAEVTRGEQLRIIASQIDVLPASKLPRRIWLDGFAQLSPPEVDLICALGKRVDLTLTLPEKGVSPDLSPTLLDRGFQPEHLAGGHTPRHIAVVPETAERESEEIVRRVLEANRAGTPFREMGVIVRQPATYEPLLRAAFERFGIPANFYFREPLSSHLAGKLLAGIVDALLSGWEHEQTLGLLRLIPGVGASNALDALAIKAKGSLPGKGLGTLFDGASGAGLRRVFRHLGSLETWLNERRAPEEWTTEFHRLTALLWPGYLPDHVLPAELAQSRSLAVGIRAFADAIESAAAWWQSHAEPIPLSEFWRVAKAVIRLASVSNAHGSRNVVHVISAYEARQWDLSIAFVCGLVDKEFPAQNSRDPFLSDAALNDLARFGIRARTAAAKDAEEEGLFDAVCARARDVLVLSYPRTDARGQRNLPSLFLKGRTAEPPQFLVRPTLDPAVAQWRQPVSIQSSDLLNVLAAKQTRLSVTSLESLLQCPFQFFSKRALHITETPERPEDRLTFVLQGNIVHEVLRDWFHERPDIVPLFRRTFARFCVEKNIVPGYRTERLRRSLELALRRFTQDEAYPRPVYSETEQSFEFALESGTSVTGKLDRIDQLDDGRWVIVDYKFSTAANTRSRVEDESKLQGPLYAVALERKFDRTPAAMIYTSLKDEKLNHFGWGNMPGMRLAPLTTEWMQNALDRVSGALAEFRSGVIHPRPLNQAPCRYCEYHDACRVEEQPLALPASRA